MRIFATSIAALLLLAAVQAPAVALDDYGIKADKKLTKALEDCADACYECGDKAKEKGLYRLARSYFDHALRYDPEHKNTRKTLGYKKKKGEWVLEDDLILLTDKINESKRAELEAKLWAETAPIRTKASAALLAFVNDTKLDPALRLLALYHVARLDPENRDCQRATRSTADRMWYKHAVDDDHDINRDKRIARATTGTKLAEESEYRKLSGIPFDSWRADWVVIHLDIGEQAATWGPALTQYAEASRSHALEMLGLENGTAPAKDEHKLHYTVLRERERFGRFIETCSGIEEASRRKEIAQVGGGTPVERPYGACWLYPNLDNDYGIRDGMAHDLAQKQITIHTGDGAFWLAFGAGYLNSTHMNGSTSSRFYAVKSSQIIDTGGVEALPGFGESPAGWRLRVVMEITGGKRTKLRELAYSRPADYDNRAMAHAYCYTDYLINMHREKLAVFLKASYEERMKRIKAKEAGETPGAILDRLFATLELDEANFQAEFEKWCLTNYIKLPE